MMARYDKNLNHISKSLRFAQQEALSQLQALSQLAGNTSRCQHHAGSNQLHIYNVGQGMIETC